MAKRESLAAQLGLTAEEILAASDLPIEAVAVPEWAGVVYVRTFTGAERDRWEQRFLKGTPGVRPVAGNPYDNLRASLCALCICDSEGRPIFEPKHVEALGKKSAAALDRVFGVAMRLNGLSKQDVEQLRKNSEGNQSEDSTTG